MTNEIHQRDTTDLRLDVLDGVSRRTLLKASGVGAGGLALGASTSPVTAQQEEEEDEDEDHLIPDFRIPYLDLDTLEAEFEGETLQAESLEDLRPGSTTYVGEAGGRPGLFVAVSHLDETDQPDEDDPLPEIVVYLCDGEVGAQPGSDLWLTGEFDETGTTLTGEEDGEVKLALVNGEFLGVATLPEGVPIPFVASEATDDAGLYQAETEVNEVEVTVRWVVLPDGRQRGAEICCLWIDGQLRCGPCIDLF